MKNGYRRFQIYLDQLTEMMNKAEVQENPALWLFRNNARTSFFMLEALARLYGKVHDKKTFCKLRDQFKQAEDWLGKIDYYKWLVDSLAVQKQIPDNYLVFVRTRLDSSTAQFNEILYAEGWISDDHKRIRKVIKKLKAADWPSSKKEIEAFEDIYKSAIKSIEKFVNAMDYHFDNVEEDVHELRRKLRWLSIYPQALQGAIRYASQDDREPHLQKYLTPEIVNSPYNKLPESDITPVLLLRKNYFLSLSWIIARLGELKDEGLLITGLSEAIENTDSVPSKDAIVKSVALLGKSENPMDRILRESEEIVRTYFMEENLQNLIMKSKS
ncbi:MAG: hypothetical protein ACM3NR_00480 [Methanosarcina sp.]